MRKEGNKQNLCVKASAKQHKRGQNINLFDIGKSSLLVSKTLPRPVPGGEHCLEFFFDSFVSIISSGGEKGERELIKCTQIKQKK